MLYKLAVTKAFYDWNRTFWIKKLISEIHCYGTLEIAMASYDSFQVYQGKKCN